MALAKSTSASAEQSAARMDSSRPNQPAPSRHRFTNLLDHVIFGCLALFAIALPHSIKGAERAWKLALVLWLIKLAVERARPYKQALAAPLLGSVVLAGIFTLLSPD